MCSVGLWLPDWWQHTWPAPNQQNTAKLKGHYYHSHVAKIITKLIGDSPSDFERKCGHVWKVAIPRNNIIFCQYQDMEALNPWLQVTEWLPVMWWPGMWIVSQFGFYTWAVFDKTLHPKAWWISPLPTQIMRQRTHSHSQFIRQQYHTGIKIIKCYYVCIDSWSQYKINLVWVKQHSLTSLISNICNL